MFKKVMSVLLILCMAAALCACTGSATSSTASKADASSAAASAAVSSEAEKLTYPVSDTLISVKGVVVDVDATNPRTVWQDVEKVTNVHFDFESIDKDSLAVYIAAGNWPDFFHTALDSTYVNDYGITGGKFVDYSKYLDLMPNLVQAFEDYPQSRNAVTETTGAIYQLPYIEVSATVTQVRCYYREDVLKAAGQKVPTTTDEFYDVLTALKAYNKGAAPLVCNFNETNYVGALLYASFGKSTTADFEDDGTGKVIYNRTSDQYRYYLEYINKLYVDGLLHKEYLTLDAATQKSLAFAGQTVFMNGTAGHSIKESDFPSGKVELNVLGPLTSEYDNERVVLGSIPFSLGGFFMNSESKYIKELCRCFDIMFATEEVKEGTGLYGESFCYGNEGVNWAYSNADHTEYEFILPEGVTDSFTKYQYGSIIYGNSGRATALAGAVTSTPGNNQARQLGFVNNVNPFMEKTPFPTKFLKFTEDEQSVLDNNMTEITKYVSEMHDKFINDVVDINDDTVWNEYCKRIESMNIADVIEVYQASYDRWNKL